MIIEESVMGCVELDSEEEHELRTIMFLSKVDSWIMTGLKHLGTD